MSSVIMNCTVDLCFMCLTNNVNLKSILTQNSDEIVIEEKCRYVLNEYVNIKPEVSYHICLNCLKTLDYAYNFKQMCLKNINKLNNYVDSLRNLNGPNKPFQVTLPDLQRLEENELTVCNASANNTFPPIALVLVKEEIADVIKEENVSNEEQSMHKDDEFTGKEKPRDTYDATDTQHSKISYEDRLIEKYLKNVKEETEFKDIHEEIHIKDEQLVNEKSDSDSEDNSNDKLDNEEEHSPEITSTSSNYSESNKSSKNATQTNKKTIQPYACDVCNKSFSQKSNLVAHIKRIHTEITSTSSNYSESNKSSKISTQTDKKTTQSFACDVCKKSFSQKNNLVAHIKRIHTGKRPFKCEYCDKTFCAKCNLVEHIRSHTGERPYECGVCSKSFAQKHVLITHERIHTRKRHFKCKYCDKAFSLENCLINHTRTHTGESLYQCDVCQKEFTKKRYLRSHKRSHTGERSYECDICKKTFMIKNYLTKHKLTHTKEKSHKCDVCDKRFKRKDILTIHKKRYHSLENP